MVDEDLALEARTDDDSAEDQPSKEEQAKARLKEAIVVERENIGTLRARLTVTIPREVLDERLGDQYTELQRDALIPGFRKGHAPRRLVEKRFSTDVGDQLKGQLVGDGFLAAVERENLKPLGDPLLRVSAPVKNRGETASTGVDVDQLLPLDKGLEHVALPREGPFQFSCEVELKPEFELPELSGIPLKRPNVTVEEKDVDLRIQRINEFRATYRPVEEGAVEEDDLLYCEMTCDVGGESFLSEESVEIPARDARIENIPVIGLGKAVTGRVLGDRIEIEAPIPEDHERVDFRGKQAKFALVIREIKRREVPPLDEEFLRRYGYDSEDELRESVRRRLEAQLGESIRAGLRAQVAEYLLQQTSLELPAALSQRQADRVVARHMIELYRQNVSESEIQKVVDDLRMKAPELAARELKQFFILEKIAEDRNIEVDEERLNGAIAEIAADTGKRFDRVRDELSRDNGLAALYYRLRDEKVLDELIASANVSELEGPKTIAAPENDST